MSADFSITATYKDLNSGVCFYVFCLVGSKIMKREDRLWRSKFTESGLSPTVRSTSTPTTDRS